MADSFLTLGKNDRREALLAAAEQVGRPAYLLEKDIWVVWTLGVLFKSKLGEHLVFKGGTSLSKAYGGLIERFSEDIDLTYDIRQLIPHLAGEAEEPIPRSKSQSRKWTDAVRAELPVWIKGQATPILQEAIAASGIDAALVEEDEALCLRYGILTEGYGYVRPEVLLEFGARSTGEPASKIAVVCDAAIALPELTFPQATPRVMAAERTFWEKATAAHVYCLKGSFRGDRFARHWHDLAKLAQSGIATRAIADRDLAARVAEHKQAFFVEKTPAGEEIAYLSAVSGALKLVPQGDALQCLEADYQAMIASGLFESDAISFDALMSSCKDIEDEANTSASKSDQS